MTTLTIAAVSFALGAAWHAWRRSLLWCLCFVIHKALGHHRQ